MNNPIEIRPSDASWSRGFVRVADELAAELGSDANIEHVGSTAVRGLAAKPVIDILVGVAQAAEVLLTIPALARLGFTPGNRDRQKVSAMGRWT